MVLTCTGYILQAKELSDNLPPAPAPARAKKAKRGAMPAVVPQDMRDSDLIYRNCLSLRVPNDS